MPNDDEINKTLDAAARLTENVPVYKDLVQPAAKELGKNLLTVSKVVTASLMPVRGLIWGFEQIESYLNESLTRKLSKTPDVNIEPPPVNVAGPVFESLRFCSDDNELKEMFANLLANSMDRASKSRAHPAFVEVLKNLNSDEAKILSYMANSDPKKSKNVIPVIDQTAYYPNSLGSTVIYPLMSTIAEKSGCDYPDLCPTYIYNLVRLGILSISDHKLVKPGIYEDILKKNSFIENKSYIEDMQKYLSEPVHYKSIFKNVYLTSFGKDMLKVAVSNKEEG